MSATSIANPQIPNLSLDSVLPVAFASYPKGPAQNTVVIVDAGKPQAKPTERDFEEFIYSPQGLLLRRAEVTFKQEYTRNRISSTKASKNKKFIALEVTRDPH
jgi:hypothetical protein